MGFTFGRGAVTLLVLLASLLVVSMANPEENHFFHPNITRPPKKIIVGGSEHWRFGFNYTTWALKSRPFFINDTLVFKYDHPNSTTPPPNVYLLPNLRSFLRCDFRKAKLVANVTQGGGEGFEFVLKKFRPHFFGCSIGDGSHCKDGKMKFPVLPRFRRRRG